MSGNKILNLLRGVKLYRKIRWQKYMYLASSIAFSIAVILVVLPEWTLQSLTWLDAAAMLLIGISVLSISSVFVFSPGELVKWLPPYWRPPSEGTRLFGYCLIVIGIVTIASSIIALVFR